MQAALTNQPESIITAIAATATQTTRSDRSFRCPLMPPYSRISRTPGIGNRRYPTPDPGIQRTEFVRHPLYAARHGNPPADRGANAGSRGLVRQQRYDPWLLVHVVCAAPQGVRRRVERREPGAVRRVRRERSTGRGSGVRRGYPDRLVRDPAAIGLSTGYRAALDHARAGPIRGRRGLVGVVFLRPGRIPPGRPDRGPARRGGRPGG